MLRLPALVLAALVAVALVGGGDALKLTKCPLARLLKAYGIPQGDLPNWVCLILGSSSGDTRLVNSHKSDGSKSYGLFQINSRYWCGTNASGGGCGVKCSSLADDDVSNDIKCAKRIKGSQGWSAWDVWTRQCKDQKLPDLRNC